MRVFLSWKMPVTVHMAPHKVTERSSEQRCVDEIVEHCLHDIWPFGLDVLCHVKAQRNVSSLLQNGAVRVARRPVFPGCMA